MSCLRTIIAWIRDPNNLTAISTAVIAFFTIALWVVGYVQARLIRKSIDLARTEFVSTHRPRLRVRRITLIHPLLPNNRCRATIEIANIGETNATIIEIGVDVYGEGYPFSAALQAREIALKAGQQATMQIMGQILTDARIDAIEFAPELC